MIPFMDTWPATPRLLWDCRHRTYRFAAYRFRFCVGCGHAYPPRYLLVLLAFPAVCW